MVTVAAALSLTVLTAHVSIGIVGGIISSSFSPSFSVFIFLLGLSSLVCFVKSLSAENEKKEEGEEETILVSARGSKGPFYKLINKIMKIK